MPNIHEQVAQLAAEDPTKLPTEVQQQEETEKGEGFSLTSLPDALITAERTLGRLATAILHSDPDEVADLLKLLSATAADITEQCARSGNTQAQTHCSALNSALPELAQRAKQAAISPESRGQLAETTAVVQVALDGIALAATQPNERIGEVAQRQLEFLNILAQSAELQDAHAVVANLKQIAATQQKLLPLVAQLSVYGEKAGELEQVIADLEALLPQNVTAAKGFLQDTSNPESQDKLIEAIDKMKAPLTAIISTLNPSSTYKRVAALEARQNSNAVLLHNSTGDSEEALTTSQAIYASGKDIAHCAQRLVDASVKEPHAQEYLAKHIQALSDNLAALALAEVEMKTNPCTENTRALEASSQAVVISSGALANAMRDPTVLHQVLKHAVETKNMVFSSLFCSC